MKDESDLTRISKIVAAIDLSEYSKMVMEKHQMSINMNQKDKVQWRRSKVQELLVKGYNHYEIASTLQYVEKRFKWQGTCSLQSEIQPVWNLQKSQSCCYNTYFYLRNTDDLNPRWYRG